MANILCAINNSLASTKDSYTFRQEESKLSKIQVIGSAIKEVLSTFLKIVITSDQYYLGLGHFHRRSIKLPLGHVLFMQQESGLKLIL